MRVIGIGNTTSRSSAPAPEQAVTAPVDVRAVRLRLGMSQSGFARRFGFRLGMLRRWESGHETPQRPALVLLNLIDRNPQVVYWMPARRRSSRSMSR